MYVVPGDFITNIFHLASHKLKIHFRDFQNNIDFSDSMLTSESTKYKLKYLSLVT